MQWCLIGWAIVLALLGIAALIVRPRHARPKVRPGLLLRGCAASVCLLAAIGLAGLALLVAR